MTDDSELFASIPDECPDCHHALEVNVELAGDGDNMDGYSEVECPNCDYAETTPLGGDA